MCKLFFAHRLRNRRIITSDTVDGCEILFQLVDGKHPILTPSVCSVFAPQRRIYLYKVVPPPVCKLVYKS